MSDVLSTRTAENLFWLGRYLERAENATRLIRALASRLIGFDAESDAMIPFIARLLYEVHAFGSPAIGAPTASHGPIRAALTDLDLVGGVRRLALAARECAAKTRDQISVDAWTVISELVDLVERGPAIDAPPQEGLSHCNEILHHVSAFAGLADNNMNRMSGWRFLQLGRAIERAIHITWLTRALGDIAAPPGGFEALLELADSQISFGTLYSNIPTRPQVMDLVLLNPHNPRSLAYQVRQIEDHMRNLPEVGAGPGPSLSRKFSITVAAQIGILAPTDVTKEKLARIQSDLASLSDAITSDFFGHWKASSITDG